MRLPGVPKAARDSLMNIASWFSAYRILAADLERERAEHSAEVAELKRERNEWQNKFLQKTSTPPLFYEPKAAEPVEQPPVGVTAKRAYLQRQPQSAVKSDEEILEAARQAQQANGNGSGS